MNNYNNYSIAFFMALIAGFSDVFSFVALDRLFCAHVTGNIIIIISFIIYNIKGVGPKIASIPIFMIFASIISFFIQIKGLKKASLCYWILIEILFFIALLLCGIFFIPKAKANSKWKVAGVDIIAASGAQEIASFMEANL